MSDLNKQAKFHLPSSIISREVQKLIDLALRLLCKFGFNISTQTRLIKQ